MEHAALSSAKRFHGIHRTFTPASDSRGNFEAAMDTHESVLKELAREPGIDTGISVAIRDGLATIWGRVTSFAQKCAAERAVRRVSGVVDVSNDLVITTVALDCNADDDIESMANLLLRWDANLPQSGINASVRQGCVTLTGDVDADWRKLAAESAIVRLRGVRAIRNLIAIKPRTNDSEHAKIA